MKFRTPIEPQSGELTLSPTDPVVMLGSCFSDNLSARMRRCLWRAENPLGVLYNPVSIAKAVNLMLCDLGLRERCESTVFESYGLYHSWLFDSGPSTTDHRLTLDIMASMSARLHYLLENGGALFVTFGTATAWFLSDRPEYAVGNCHKQPAMMFSHRRLDIKEICDEWTPLVRRLQDDYPGLPVVFTVSPVRYLKEGFVENARSKATLLLAVEQICRDNPNCHYFPAFEIFNDDLRDYRFYASDLVHPSAEGVDYLWEVFQETYLDDSGKEILKAGRDIANRYFHRPNVCIRTREQEESLQRWKEDTVELWYNPYHDAYPETMTLAELSEEYGK